MNQIDLKCVRSPFFYHLATKIPDNSVFFPIPDNS